MYVIYVIEEQDRDIWVVRCEDGSLAFYNPDHDWYWDIWDDRRHALLLIEEGVL